MAGSSTSGSRKRRWRVTTGARCGAVYSATEPTRGLKGQAGQARAAVAPPTGNLRFGKVFGDPNRSVQPFSAAFDSAGDTVLAGWHYGLLDVGGGPVGEELQYRLIVAKLDPVGNHVWNHASTKQNPTSTQGPGGALAIDGADHILLDDTYGVLELSPSGSLVANHTLGGSGHHTLESIGFGPGGERIIAGRFDDTIDLGQGLLSAGADWSTFVGVLGH